MGDDIAWVTISSFKRLIKVFTFIDRIKKLMWVLFVECGKNIAQIKRN